MANLNVPGPPRIVRMVGNEIRISWTTPARLGYTWNVYVGVATLGAPVLGPPLNAHPVPTQTFRFSLTDVAGNVTGGSDLYVAVTSVLTTNGQESAQSEPMFVNVDAGDPSRPNQPTVGRSPLGSPTYLATDEDGHLLVSAGSLRPEESFLRNHYQTDVLVSALPRDILQPPAIVSPLENRKMVVLQNRGPTDILLGTATLQNHLFVVGGVRTITAPEISIGMFARIVSGDDSLLNVWEFA